MALERCKLVRVSAKRNIRHIQSVIDGDTKTPLSAAYLQTRLGILETYFTHIMDIQTEIESLDSDDRERPHIEDLYVSIKVNILSKLEALAEPPRPIASCSSPHTKLPALDLPKFSGKSSDYKNFITSFMQTIDLEPCFTNVEKFNHLRNCLCGPALETINAFQITNDNYKKALDRLQKRYDNNTLIFMENINELFRLKSISRSSPPDLRSLIDNASALFSSLLSLGDEKAICNAMLIHIVLNKTDPDSRNTWKRSLDFK